MLGTAGLLSFVTSLKGNILLFFLIVDLLRGYTRRDGPVLSISEVDTNCVEILRFFKVGLNADAPFDSYRAHTDIRTDIAKSTPNVPTRMSPKET